MFKPETRIIAWDDCAFKFRSKKVRLVGAIFRGGSFLDGLLSTEIEKDGTDATEKIAHAVKSSRHYDQLSVIMTNGITFAGLNLIDINKLRKKTGLPVLAVQRNMPDMEKFLLALRRTEKSKKKHEMVKAAGKIHGYREIHYQKSGMTKEEAEEILKLTCTRAKIPEPLRVAHLIASGLSGESKGRA